MPAVTSRRRVLELLGTGMVTGLAGCSQMSGTSSDTTPTQQQTETATETSSVQTPSSSEKTLVPSWGVTHDMFNVEVRDNSNWMSVQNASDRTFTKIDLDGDVAVLDGDAAVYFIEPGEEAFKLTIRDNAPSLGELVKGVYRSSYYPPKAPYNFYDVPIVSGSETDSGLVFDFSNLDGGDVRDVDIWESDGIGNLVSSDASKSPVVTDNTLRIPWSAVDDKYLTSPLYYTKVTTVTEGQMVALEPPAPPVSVERSVDVEDRGDYLQVRSIRFDVSFESKKPTQYLQATATGHPSLLQRTFTKFQEYQPILDVTSSTAPTIELSGEISYPLPGEGTLPVIVMQGAPLYTEQIDLTSYI